MEQKKEKRKKSAEESLAVWGDGGLIHTQHYHFDGFDAVFGGGGGRALEEKREREREREVERKGESAQRESFYRLSHFYNTGRKLFSTVECYYGYVLKVHTTALSSVSVMLWCAVLTYCLVR